MCGICGLIKSDKYGSIDKPLLVKMNATMNHRGPDDEGYFVKGNVGMAMRRLAIIDVKGGNQPVYNEDKSIVVVFNGEIYNYKKLRKQLQKSNHKFKSKSDTEVIVHAYEQWGDEMLLHFNGMFAIALWDERKKRLLLARDRMGQKPLYWHNSSKAFSWSSEAKGLLQLPWVKRKVNPFALHHYLTLQYTPNPLTIFEKIYQLPAAHKLVIKSGGTPKISRWWQLSFEPKWNIGEQEAIKKTQTLLETAVKRRLISEVPLGVFLSGGIDSSIIVSLMAENSSKPVKTFSIGFDENHFSELDYAKQIALQYQTDHHEFIFQPKNLTKLIETVVSSTDEPLADPAALPLYELARQTRQFVTVALCGDGGDETLAGYQRYYLDRLLHLYAKLPATLTQHVIPAIVDHFPDSSWIPVERNFISGIKRLKQFSNTTPKASLVRWGSYFSHESKLNLYSMQYKKVLTNLKTSELLAEIYGKAHANNHLDRSLYTDHNTYLAGNLLPKTDRMTMAHSLEARAPLLDSQWVEWTARLPEKYKLRGLRTKWLLKAAFANKIPPSIVKRSKTGFGVPIGHWLRYDLRDWARNNLLENSNLSEFFSQKTIKNLFKQHDNGKINHGKRLWALLIFSVWQKKYLTNPN